MPSPKPHPLSPTAEEVHAWRRDAGLSAAAAGALVHISGRAWQQYEGGSRTMHPAFWELARAKASRRTVVPTP